MKKNGFFRVKVLLRAVVFCLLFNVLTIFAKDELGLPDAPEMELDDKNSMQTIAVIAELKARIEKDPADTENYTVLACFYDYLGMHEEALKVLFQKLEHYYGPDWHVLYYNIAKTYINLDQLEEGKAYLDKAMKYQPDDVYNNVLLMEYSIVKKDYQQAAKCMKLLAEIVPDKDWYYDTYLKVYSWEDREGYDFVALYKEALKENPENHYAIRAYALMLRNQRGDDFLKEFSFIMKELMRACKLKPDYVFHYVGISNTYLWKWGMKGDKRDLTQALKWMKKAHKLELIFPRKSGHNEERMVI
ncbi:MAG: hypothetical protein HY810_00415 [Candidatus Omnitrophica bacterium]|nr:hypothetical protein [Candidatus Omnitrophota bacterium]